MIDNFDYIVVGTGFSGATAANLLAEKGYKVLVIEKRAEIGGNMFDEKDGSGSYVHRYGPHLFHTGISRVYNYVCSFSEFYEYKHKVFGSIDGEIVPIPFNFESIDKLFSKEQAESYKKLLAENYPGREKITINELRQNANSDVKAISEYVYQKVFLNYTKKQWGVGDPSELDGLVTDRVPVALGFGNNYFTDKYQVMPKNGYSLLFGRMLDHKNIQLMLNTDALDVIEIDWENNTALYSGQPFAGKIIYTGQIDSLLKYKFGKLEYRTVEFRFETLPMRRFQQNSVINYPNEHDYTRITEFKHFMQEFPQTDKTTIMYEYPKAHGIADEPYYPVPKNANKETYEKYRNAGQSINNIEFLGRLAEYKYYNMDQAIENAMNLVNRLTKDR